MEPSRANVSNGENDQKLRKEPSQHKSDSTQRYNLWETALQCRISLQPQDLGLTRCFRGESRGRNKHARQ